MKQRSVVMRLSALRERLQMLSFMINDCGASFEEKRKYRLRRKQQAVFFKVVITIVFIIIFAGLLYLLVINFTFSIY